jgi:hypothetical protein
MTALLPCTFGVLIFLGINVASFPFGFIDGYKKARGYPSTEYSTFWLRKCEYLLEFSITILLLANISHKNPTLSLINTLISLLIANVICYIFDVLVLKQPSREFFLRGLVSFFVCLPLGLFFGTYDGLIS